MVDNDDIELMAALFVSEDGELRVEPDWIESGKPESGWWLPHLEAAVAAGILRLIRERDEARQKAADWEQTARELTARVKHAPAASPTW